MSFHSATPIALVVSCAVHHQHLLPSCATACDLAQRIPTKKMLPKSDYGLMTLIGSLALPETNFPANGTLGVGDGAGARAGPLRGHRAACRTTQRRPTAPNRLVIPTRARVAALTTIGARPTSCRVSEEDKELSRVLALSITACEVARCGWYCGWYIVVGIHGVDGS